MGVFDGFYRTLENIMGSRELEIWDKNSGITLMESIEITLRRDGKSPHRFTTAMGEQGLEYVMYGSIGPMQVCIMEDEDSNLGISTFYPVNTSHLTSYDIQCMIDEANAQCEGGVVVFDEELQLLSYIVVFNLSGAESKGISIDFLLHEASAKTNNALDYFDDMRERFNLYT